MFIKEIYIKIRKIYFTILAKMLSRAQIGKNVCINHKCKFTKDTSIGNNCHFNGIKISGKGKVSIGNNCHFGSKIRVITTNHNYEGEFIPYDNTFIHKDVIIEDNVWIGEGVLILGGVTLGEGCIIQAGSVIAKDVPKLAIAGGHPAVPFKYRNKEHYYRLKGEGSFF